MHAVARARGTFFFFFFYTAGWRVLTCASPCEVYRTCKRKTLVARFMSFGETARLYRHACIIVYDTYTRPVDLPCRYGCVRVFFDRSLYAPPYGIILLCTICSYHARNARSSAHNGRAAKTGHFRKTPSKSGPSKCSAPINDGRFEYNLNLRLSIRGHVFFFFFCSILSYITKY